MFRIGKNILRVNFSGISKACHVMLKTCTASLLLLIVLGGCSMVPSLDKVMPDNRIQYKKSKTLPDLEIPPDLTTKAIQDLMVIPSGAVGETASFSTYQERAADRKRDQELERSESGAIKLLENEHILAVEGVAAQIWPKLRDFWGGLGYGLELDDEELGVVETLWNENQEELVRDKFKIFAEPGQQSGTTLLYVSHRGEELVPQGDKLVWQARLRDIELERRVVELLEKNLNGVGSRDTEIVERGSALESDPSSLMVQSDVGRAELISAGGGKIYLALAEDFSAAWESLAIVLGRTGVVVEREDESRGLYFVRMPSGDDAEEKGVLSKLKFWGGDDSQFQLSLTGVGEKTEIVLLNQDGKWETSEVASDLLTRLNDELNAHL